MRKDFIPDGDAALLAFAANLDAQFDAVGASLPLSPVQLAQYHQRFEAFRSTLSAAREPATRGGATILAKRQAKKSLVRDIRVLSRILQSDPGTTDPQRHALGLPIYKVGRSSIPAPTTWPVVRVVAALGRTVMVRLHDSATGGRARPAHTTGATIMAFVGPAPSPNPTDFRFMGHFNQTTCELTFDPAVPNGATVWISAAWVGVRMTSGPASPPTPLNLPGTPAMAA